MTFLSGQDDFFQTANQPISVRHLSEPYNKNYYYSQSQLFSLAKIIFARVVLSKCTFSFIVCFPSLYTIIILTENMI